MEVPETKKQPKQGPPFLLRCFFYEKEWLELSDFGRWIIALMRI